MITLSHIVEVCNSFCTFALMMHFEVIGAVMACVILYLYNGTRGFIQGSIAQYGFYAFYPVHFYVMHYINSTYFS